MGGAGLEPLAEISRTADFPDLEDTSGWNIYLDDTTVIEQVSEAVAAELKGKPSEEEKKLRDAYAWWGIPTNTQKALERTKEAERLGSLIDGKKGVLRTTSKRSLDLMGLGTWIRGLTRVPRKALQVYAGKAVHVLQFRRPLFSVMDVIFKAIGGGIDFVQMSRALAEEMLLLEALLPLAQTDLRAKVNPIVTWSDASETGGGTCFAARLSRAGMDEAMKLMETKEEESGFSATDSTDMKDQKVLVIDLFSGIGGLEVALEKAGVKASHSLFVESDPHCRRLLRRKFPGADFSGDIKKVDEAMIRKSLGKLHGITGIVVGGGSPCQGISKLSSERTHMQNVRSALFYEAVRVMDIVMKVANEAQVWVIKWLENVLADLKDVEEIGAMKIRPVLVESSEISRVRRPRLYWFSPGFTENDEVKVSQGPCYDRLHLEAPKEPLEIFLNEGTSWPAGERDEKMRFPTFTRSIPRKKPPPSPAGIETTDAAAQERWKDHGFRYPPYTYREEFMVKGEDNVLRPLCADEREVLMGFPRGFCRRKAPKALKKSRLWKI